MNIEEETNLMLNYLIIKNFNIQIWIALCTVHFKTILFIRKWIKR